MNDYIESLRWRYATKKYDPSRKVSAEDIEKLKEAVRLSVSSVGLQPYKVVIVENPEIRSKLKEAAGGNNKNLIMDASHLFVFANEINPGSETIENYINNISKTRGVEQESLKGFGAYISDFLAGLTEQEKNTWTAKQSYIALSTLINSAAMLKIDTTAMEGFNAEEFNKILGFDKLGLNTAVIAAVGYRHKEDANQHLKKVRKPKEELFITV